MQEKKGISLIVLVITIIVMIVLAGAIILSLNNAGIIGKANQAVRDTDEATVKELAQMAWAEAYTEYGENKDKLEEGVKNTLIKNKINLEDYAIIVTTRGVEISKGWLRDGLTVIKGSQKLCIGDVVNYDETKGGTVAVEKDVMWKVLGVDNGELLVVSADNVVDSYGLGDYNKEGNISLAKEDYINGISKLNTVCEVYGKGKGALGARSITIEDVNKITGYNPEKALFGEKELYEYGNKVTFIWNGSSSPYYKATNKLEGLLQTKFGGSFTYYDGEKFVISTNAGATTENFIEITTLKTDYYYYYPTTLSDDSTKEQIGLATDSKAYKMLFRNRENTKDDVYWLASMYSYVDTYCAGYGMRAVLAGGVSFGDFVYANSTTNGGFCGVRAVVTLSSDINFTGSAETGWSY